MIEPTEHQRHNRPLISLIATDEYDPDEGATYINEIMAEDDAKDPYLEGYQQYAN